MRDILLHQIPWSKDVDHQYSNTCDILFTSVDMKNLYLDIAWNIFFPTQNQDELFAYTTM